MRLVYKFGDFLLAAAILLAVDTALFHLSGYTPWLRPDSYSGHIEQTTRRFRITLQTVPGRQRVAVLGDSTTGSAVQERKVEAKLAEAGLDFYVINMAQGGSSPRGWYFLAKHERITSENTRLLILGVFPSSLQFFQKPKPDLQILKTRLSVTDALTLARSYRGVELSSAAFFQTLYRTPLFKDDVVDFLEDPRARLASVASNRRWETRFARQWRRENEGRRDLTNVRLDEAGNLVESTLSSNLKDNPEMKQDLAAALRLRRQPGARPRSKIVMDPESGRLLAALVRLLNRRGVGVVIAITPRSPFPSQPHELEALEALCSTLRGQGARVELFHDIALLDRLEQPQYFRDMLHLNQLGADIYSDSLGQFVAALLVRDPPRPGPSGTPEGPGRSTAG